MKTLLLLIAASAAADPKWRTWRDASGDHQVVASVVSADQFTVVLQRQDDGREVTVPIDRLSREDRLWLEKQAAVDRLKAAWRPLVPSADRRKAIDKMTSFQRMGLLIESTQALHDKHHNQWGSIVLETTGVIEPTAYEQKQWSRGLALVHGVYAEKEYRDVFSVGGMLPTIGIWTQQFDVLKTLSKGDRFLLTGRMFYEIAHLKGDVPRPRIVWRQNSVNTSVVYLSMSITGLSRHVRIYLQDPKITPISSQARRQ